MAHASRSAARKYRRRLQSGWSPPDIGPVEVMRKGKSVLIERSHDNMRRDLFVYRGSEIVSLTALAHAQGYKLR